MIYFLLPSVQYSIYTNIDCITYNDNENIMEPIISTSLAYYLYDIKSKLNKYKKNWDTYKRYTNPYEYINSYIPNKTMCVSKYKPLSRSYFKMIELLTFFEIYSNNKAMNINIPIKTFHLAEGPGGFIEAIVNIRNNPNDKYIGMTILDEMNDCIPSWKKSESFLKKNPNVFIETSADKTGNILSLHNFIYCKDKYKSSMDLITADGGFDFSIDFNKQEENIIKLLFGQVCYALCMQKLGGSFVLKIFDCFMQHTIDILYILSAFYEKVYITKPHTSRYANSEKYIVCKNFLFYTINDFYPILLNAFEKMLDKNMNIDNKSNCTPFLFTDASETDPQWAVSSAKSNGFVCIENSIKLSVTDLEQAPRRGAVSNLHWYKTQTFGGVLSHNGNSYHALEKCEGVKRFLNIKIPSFYISKLEEFNAIFGQQQLDNIYQTITLIENKPKNDKIENMTKSNIQKCIHWCTKYNIPYNNTFT